MKNSREYSELKKTLGNSFKTPRQINKLFEADCEIVKLAPKRFLTTSIDSISEEIDIGLYQDVETWAWMAVMSSVSDLAASASSPIGLTLSSQWKYGTEQSQKNAFYKTINRACKKANVPLLGGDSGSGVSHAFTTSIIGESTLAPLMRIGAREGDFLVLSHQKKTGIGPALAYRFLMKGSPDILAEKLFRPTPSWVEAQKLAPFVHAAIDTSDGIATSVFIFSELNHLGVDLFWNKKVNHPNAMSAMSTLKISPLFLWLGDHGDFQTLYVIPKKHINKIPLSTNLSIIGQFRKKSHPHFRIEYNHQWVDLPITSITQCGRDVDSYSRLLKDMQKYLATYK